MEFHVCCTRLVKIVTVNADCGGQWSCRLMMSHMCLNTERPSRSHQHVNIQSNILDNNNGMKTSVILFGNTSLILVHQWQYNTLNSQVDVQIWYQGDWYNSDVASVITGNCSPDLNSRCVSMCIGCRQVGCWCTSGLTNI